MDIRKLQRAIVDGLEDVKAQNIVVFNTEALSPLFERVIVASGTSNRQTKALASSVRETVKARGMEVLRTEGEDNGEWIIVDCGAAVAHIMQPAVRDYYHLEEIWGSKPVRLKTAAAAPGLPKAGAGDAARAPATGAAPKRGAAKKVAASKAADSKEAARKVTTGKVASKKVASQKVASQKVATKKVAAKKLPARRASSPSPLAGEGLGRGGSAQARPQTRSTTRAPSPPAPPPRGVRGASSAAGRAPARKTASAGTTAAAPVKAARKTASTSAVRTARKTDGTSTGTARRTAGKPGAKTARPPRKP
jgi:ribosome-associated protein